MSKVKYSARVTFTAYGISRDPDKQINKLIDKLGAIDTGKFISWNDVEWVIDAKGGK